MPTDKQASDFKGFNILVQDALPLKEDDFGTSPIGAPKEVPPTTGEGTLRIPKKVTDEPEDTVDIPEETIEETEDLTEGSIEPKKTEPKKDGKDKTEANPFQAFAEFLGEKGLLDTTGKSFESEEDLSKAWEESIDEGVNSWKSSLGQESQKFIDYLEQGGDPANYIQKKASFSYLKTTDDQVKGDETIQKNAIKDLLTKQGYSFEDIKEKIKDYEDSGLLEKEALRAAKQLRSSEENEDKSLVENQRKEATQRQEQYKTYLKNLEDTISKKTEIAGFPINDKQKKAFYEYITRPSTEVNGQPSTQLIADTTQDPEGQLKMAWFYFNKFDFSKFQKKAENQAVSGLKSALSRYTDSRERTSRTPNSSEEKPDLNIFKKNLNL